jgi:photosystem II stability/assembly factor-like uncharacterized protein
MKNLIKISTVSFLMLFNQGLEAQQTDGPPASSLLSALPIRNVGPMTKNGIRFDALAVYEPNSRIFYCGSANGGVLKTTDGGITSKFVFDKEGSASIGAVTVSQKDPNLVWVGTGDRWQRNSVGMGDGVYKSTDGGKTWACLGLKESISIGRIAIHPKDNNIVLVAVLGSPWGYGPDRGIYKTRDGGKTWKKVLYVNEKTAGADVMIDPENPNNVLASMDDHIHRPWGYFPTGPGSGIFKSTDGGETWHRVTKGLPKNDMGRIAFDYFRPNPKEVVAAIEAAYPATGIYRSHDGGETWIEMPAVHYDYNGNKMDNKGQDYWYRPHYNQVVRFSTKDLNTIYHGNAMHYSKDGGKTWKGTTGDEHELWIDPKNADHWIVLGDQDVQQSWNGEIWNKENGTTRLKKPSSLFQTYGCGYDMRKLYWVMGSAQDCGGGILMPTQAAGGNIWEDDDLLQVSGQESGGTMADPKDWTIIYSRDIAMLARTDLKTGQCIRPYREVFSYSSLLPYFGYEQYKKQEMKIRPSPREAFGFEISSWNSQTVYFGTNYLFRSTDGGRNWNTISGDLSHNNPKWQVPDGSVYINSGVTSYQSISSISESPLKQGMIWVGTDCGYVQMTMDEGAHWINLTKNIPGLPDSSWVSKIYASHHKEGRAYVTFDNHRNFDLKPYVYVTEDYGKTWTKINGNLPEREPVRVIQEGLKNPDLLFLGTEFGLWVSIDRGVNWTPYEHYAVGNRDNAGNIKRDSGYFPKVAVYDLKIHPRELDLIVGSHGRGIWILPVRALEELTLENRSKDVYFTRPGNIYLFPFIQKPAKQFGRDSYSYVNNTQPGTTISYYLKKDALRNEADIKITSASGDTVYNQPSYMALKGTAKAGLNSLIMGPIITRSIAKTPGDYRVVLTIDGKEYYQTLHVEDATNEVLAGVAVAKKFKEKSDMAAKKKKKDKNESNVAD